MRHTPYTAGPYTPLIPPPVHFGFPAKFASYRRHQDRAVMAGLQSESRFVAQCAPVGFGKSVNALMQAILAGKKCVILTATKGLQDQYVREFGEMGLVDQRGRDNYPFPQDPEHATCDEGPCMGGLKCGLRKLGQCPYANSVKQFNESRIAVTNYAWWLAMSQNDKGVTLPDLLVCDEAHDAPNQLENALEMYIGDGDIRHMLTAAPPMPEDEFFVDRNWAQWAGASAYGLGERLTQMEDSFKGVGLTGAEYKEFKRIGRLAGKLRLLAMASPSCLWVWERKPNGWQFNPLHPAQFAENWLFQGIGRVLLTSGTLTRATVTNLGVHPSQLDYQDYPSPFDPKRAPIYRYNTGIRWDKHTSQEDTLFLISMMDNLIRGRLDRKGLMHTVSYPRQQFIYRHSQFQHIMWGNSQAQRKGNRAPDYNPSNDPTSTANVVAGFKNAPAPALLVSPTVTTGWDFPLRDAEYQFIPKLPFPDASSRIMKARAKVDPNYAANLCAVEIQQICGRGMRGELDQCETFIMDEHAKWFLGKNRGLFNRSFWDFLRVCDGPPTPPPPL